MFGNFIIHQILSNFLQPLRDFRACTTWVGKQRVAPVPSTTCLYVLSVVLFLLGFGFLLAWPTSGPSRSFINRSWHSYWRDVTLSSILSFSSLNFTYCRWRRWGGRRCWGMTLLSWKCLWSWWIRSQRTTLASLEPQTGTKFSVLQGIRIPFLMRCGFLTIDPFIRIYVFIAKLSERQYCWRVLEDFHSQEYVQFFDILRCLFKRLHFLHWRLWLS